MLDEISSALAGIGGDVYYGIAAARGKADPWDYTVFYRSSTGASRNLTSRTDRYAVAVVREGYVPEDMLARVVEAMSAIPGMKLDSATDVDYVYGVKPKTSVTVEMMIVSFVRGDKR